MKGKSTREIVYQYILPSIPPLAAVVMIIIQQLYYPHLESTTPLNILLIFLNLLEFLLLFSKLPSSQILCWIGISGIALLAFLFNIQVGGIATPLSDIMAFIDSICGLWVVILTLEILFWRFFCLSRTGLKDLSPSESSSPGEDARNTETMPYATEEEPASHNIHADSSPSKADTAPDRTVPHPRKEAIETETTPDCSKANVHSALAKTKANYFLFTFFASALLLPFANWASFKESTWMRSVTEIAKFIFGDKISNKSTAITVLFYLLGLFVIIGAIFFGIIIVQYVLTRYLSGTSSKNNFFEEYSTPIIVLVVAGAFIMAIRSQNTSTESDWNILEFVSGLFTYIVGILVAIIALLVAFETIRLVLDQCIKGGSLLKGSMHLIFILIIQYAMGLLMGILRIFALKDVIESLLLFFLPDLEQSVEPEVKQVFNAALRHEVNQTAKDMKLTRPLKQQRHGTSKYRIIQKRRRRRK